MALSWSGVLFGVISLACIGLSVQHDINDTKIYANAEHKLRDEVFHNYDKDMAPFLNHQANMTLEFQLTVVNIVELNEQAQTFSLSGWLRMSWTDFRFKWNGTKIGVPSLSVSPSNVWVPDVILYNSGPGSKSYHSSRSEGAPVLIFPSGYVMYFPPVRYEATCKMNLRKFPFDTHNCAMVFGSWTYTDTKMKLIPAKGSKEFEAELEYFDDSNSEWDLKAVNGTKLIKYYSCCPNMPFAMLTYNFTFSRKSDFFSRIYIGPAVVISILIPFLFTMSPDDNGKTTLGAGIMVSLILLLIMLENFYPSAMTGVPILAEYYSSSIVLVALSIILNIFTNKMMKKRHAEYPHRFLSWVFIDCFGKILCLNQESYRQVEADSQPVDLETELGDPGNDTPRTKMCRKMRPGQLEWLMVGIVMDRLLFVLFSILIIVISIIMLS